MGLSAPISAQEFPNQEREPKVVCRRLWRSDLTTERSTDCLGVCYCNSLVCRLRNLRSCQPRPGPMVASGLCTHLARRQKTWTGLSRNSVGLNLLIRRLKCATSTFIHNVAIDPASARPWKWRGRLDVALGRGFRTETPAGCSESTLEPPGFKLTTSAI